MKPLLKVEQQALAKKENHAAETPPAVITVEKVNFDYTIHGGDEQIRPMRVFDDGAKTYIQMSPELQHREAPVLLVVGKDGKSEMTNYRVKDQIYIVDRLFDRANLVLIGQEGPESGDLSWTQTIVPIINRSKRQAESTSIPSRRGLYASAGARAWPSSLQLRSC